MTNQTLWKYQTGSSVESSPAVVGGVVYVGALWNGNNGFVYALNAASGSQIWSFRSPHGSYNGGSFYYSSPAVANGVVYVGSYDGYIYALNAANGGLLWAFRTGNYVFSSPVVAGGVVCVGSFDGNVYALDAITGSKIWSYQTGNEMRSSAAVANGVIYVGSGDGYLYAFGAPSAQPTPTPATTPTPTLPPTQPTPSSTPTPNPTPTTKSTHISISVGASPAAVGSAVNVKGSLSDLNGNLLQDKLVTLSYTVAGSAPWGPIGSGTTNAAGDYNIQWVNTALGTFTLKIEWIGNAHYLASSNTRTISFLPYENSTQKPLESFIENPLALALIIGGILTLPSAMAFMVIKNRSSKSKLG